MLAYKIREKQRKIKIMKNTLRAVNAAVCCVGGIPPPSAKASLQLAANGSGHCFCGCTSSTSFSSWCTLKWFSKVSPQPREEPRRPRRSVKNSTWNYLCCFFPHFPALATRTRTLLSPSRSEGISLQRENGGEIIENDFCGICFAKRKLISNTRKPKKTFSGQVPQNLLNEDVWACVWHRFLFVWFFLLIFVFCTFHLQTNPHFFYKPSWLRLNAAWWLIINIKAKCLAHGS